MKSTKLAVLGASLLILTQLSGCGGGGESNSDGASTGGGNTGGIDGGLGGSSTGGAGLGGSSTGGAGLGGSSTGGAGLGGSSTGGAGLGGSAMGGSNTGGSSTGGGNTGGGDSGGTGNTGGDGGNAGNGGDPGSGGNAGSSGDGGEGGNAPECDDHADCDNQLFCDGVESCVDGVCVAGTPHDCSAEDTDSFACTVMVCDEVNDECVRVEQDLACADDLFCNGIEKCDPEGLLGTPDADGCVATDEPDCSDGAACTIDSCVEDGDGTGHCSNTPGAAATLCSDSAVEGCTCDNGLWCDGAESCSPNSGGADPTTGCASGPAPDCADTNDCTVDACTEDGDGTGHCTNVPDHSVCDDGAYCNGAEICDATAGCLSGANPCSGDEIACTETRCDEGESSAICSNAPVDALCGDGEFCNPNDGCSLGKSCSGPGDLSCDDGNPCNGIETCGEIDTDVYACQPGEAIVCTDGASCSEDFCCSPDDFAAGKCSDYEGEKTVGECVYKPQNFLCSDLDQCTGVEVCNPSDGSAGADGCTNPPNVDCDDGVSCTMDSCVKTTGACRNIANNSICDDDVFCNGQEVCDGDAGCVNGSPPTCAGDGIACTLDFCDPVKDACVNQVDDSLCEVCGETCSPDHGGCGNFCELKTCQGKVYGCGDCIDNDGDCRIDSGYDEHCIGVCDNNERGFDGQIPGQNNSPCKADCYFDQDSGSGNDSCVWNWQCDPLEPKADSDSCDYCGEPGDTVPTCNMKVGNDLTCTTGYQNQLGTCLDYCGPLTPNGCDCFGCCYFDQLGHSVYLGTESNAEPGNPDDPGGCYLGVLDDPTRCAPCTQVQACNNTCETCEICVGKDTLPPECDVQICPAGRQVCGQPGQDPCPSDEFCVTGCCQPLPQ